MNKTRPEANTAVTTDLRPKNIGKRPGLALVIFALMELFIWPAVAGAGMATGRELLDCVNTVRGKAGIKSLAMDDSLNAAAAMKLDDMQSYDYWSHGNPQTGAKPWDFVDDAGYDYAVTGENLAIGYRDSAEICAAWEKSPTHFGNMVNPAFSDAGLAIETFNNNNESGSVLAVMMFGGKDANGALRGSGEKTSDSIDAENIRNASAELRNIMAFVIMFSYVTTFAVLLYNYVSKKKKTHTAIGKPVLIVLAVFSVIMTLAFFLLIT